MAGRTGSLYLANVKTHQLAPTAITASTQQSSYPASNANVFTKPFRPWRPLHPLPPDTAHITYDLGAPQAIGALHIGHLEPNAMLSIGMKLSSTPDFAFGTVVFSKDIYIQSCWNPLGARYGYTHVFTTAIPTARYARAILGSWTIDATKPEAGIGNFVVVAADPTCLIPNRPPWEPGWRPGATIENRFLGGGAERLRLSERAMTLALPWAWAFDPLNFQPANETDLVMSRHVQANTDEPVLVVLDSENLPSYTMIAYRALGDVTLQSQSGIGATMPLAFEEILG